MIYPDILESYGTSDSSEKISSVAKIVTQGGFLSNKSYIYVLSMNRRKGAWVHGNPVYFYFAKFELSTYMSMLGGKVKNFSDRYKNLSNTFPVSLRHISPSGTFVFERPPFNNTFRYQPMKAHGATKTQRPALEYNVWFPWSVYVLPKNYYADADGYPFQDPYVFFTGSKLSSFEDSIYNAPLPNIFGDSRACMGGSNSLIMNQWTQLRQVKTPTYADAFNICINNFFSGGWNNDILPSHTIPRVMRYNYYANHNAFDDNEEQEQKNREYSLRVSNPSGNQFSNYLKLWSQMTLEEVLEAYSDEQNAPIHTTNIGSFLSEKGFNATGDVFNNVFGNNPYGDITDRIDYNRSDFVQIFTNSPIDESVESCDEIRSQDYYYNMLDALISHYNVGLQPEQKTFSSNDEPF